MDANDVLIDALGRSRDQVPALVEGLSEDDLAWRPDEGANSIAWLVWHLTRVTDDHVAELAGRDQVWTAEGWADRFALPFAVGEHGYGHPPEQVAQVRASGELLAGYHEAVAAMVERYVAGLDADDFDRVVDTRWDPPVTLGARLVSVVNEVAAHLGQAQYVRGLLERR
ncbi:MAG: mycothiol transferase [Nocardioides sp.]